MKFLLNLFLWGALVSSAILNAACQRVAPVSINDIPIFQGMSELPAAATETDPAVIALVKQDMALRKAFNQTYPVAYRAFRYMPNAKGGMGQDEFLKQIKAAGWETRWGWTPAEQIYDRVSQMLVLHWSHDTILMTLNTNPNY